MNVVDSFSIRFSERKKYTNVSRTTIAYKYILGKRKLKFVYVLSESGIM